MSEKLKTSRMYVRVNDKEKEIITEKAAELNISRCEYILQCIRKNKIITLQGVDEVIRQLYKIGSNINQIAAKANSISYISQSDVDKTKEYVVKVFKIVEKFIDENNKHINREIQNELTEEQKFELILEKLSYIELMLGSEKEDGILCDDKND